MDTSKSPVQVEIFGQSYNLRGDADTSYISGLAEYVDRKMREVSDAGASMDPLKIAILAALNISDEKSRQLKEKDAREEEANQKLDELLTSLDACLETPKKGSFPHVKKIEPGDSGRS